MKLLARPKGRSLPLILAAAVLMSTSPMVTGCSRGEDQPAAASSSGEQPSVAATAAPAAPAPAAAVEPGPPPGAATAQELQELVSPIALYPDVLVAQILAGSTYPTQVVEADRWLKQNPNLSGDQLADQVNQQAVGSQHQVADSVPDRASNDERQPGVDLGAGRGVLQPARRRDECYPGPAQDGDGRGNAEVHDRNRKLKSSPLLLLLKAGRSLRCSRRSSSSRRSRTRYTSHSTIPPVLTARRSRRRRDTAAAICSLRVSCRSVPGFCSGR